MFRYPRLAEIVATDTYFASRKSLEGYYCSQVYLGCTSGIIEHYGMKTESEFLDTYKDFMRERGIPHTLRRDNAQSENSNKIKEVHRDLIISDQFTEPYHPQQNPAEAGAVRFLKHNIEVLLNKTGSPDNLWFLCGKYLCDVYNVCANPNNDWKIPNQASGGDTPDISHLLAFHWYQQVLYLDPTSKFPHSKEKPGYFVGFAHNSGDALTFKILREDHKTVLVRSVVRPRNDPNHPNKRVTFQEDKEEATPVIITEDNENNQEQSLTNDRNKIRHNYEENLDKGIATRTRSKIQNRGALKTSTLQSVPEEEPTKESFLENIPKLKKSQTLKFFHTSQTTVWIPETKDNPYIDISEEEQFKKKFLSTDMDWITKTEGTLPKLEDSIHEAYEQERSNTWTWPVKKVLRHSQFHTSRGDNTALEVLWDHPSGEKSWIDFYSLALHDPISILKYARKKHIVGQDPFKRLGKLFLYKIQDIRNESSNYTKAYKANTNVFGRKYKFGVEVPRSVRHALQLDKENGNTLWKDAIQKEMDCLNKYQVFKLGDFKEESPPEGYKKVPHHIVFDVKFDLRRRARLVGGGNHTQYEKDETYSGVVGMDTVRWAIFLGELNGLKCCAADIGSAYLHGITNERIFIVAGPEFGELEGRTLIIYKGLYGLRTSAARWHEHLALRLRNLGFKPSRADPDLWIKKMEGYYAMLATFVDDILIWCKEPMKIIKALQASYELKGVGIPEYYLGGNVEFLDEHWNKKGINMGFSSKTYVSNIIPKFEALFEQNFKQIKTPMAEDYHPEIDETPDLSPDDGSKYRSVIGSLNWIVTLGRFDVHYATSVLSRFGMCPKQGHLKAAIRVLCYLKTFPKGRLLFDTSFPATISESGGDYNWDQFYPDACEEVPPDLPTPLSPPVRITAYVDADHAHDVATRRSVTGVMIFLNNCPIRSICKRQMTVETSTYGSELVATKVAVEAIMELRYQLRMVGVPLEGPAMLYGDNMSVVLSTTVPSSVLKKKMLALCYHRIREAIAAKVIVYRHIKSESNLADMLTKPLGGEAFHRLVGSVLFRTP